MGTEFGAAKQQQPIVLDLSNINHTPRAERAQLRAQPAVMELAQAGGGEGRLRVNQNVGRYNPDGTPRTDAPKPGSGRIGPPINVETLPEDIRGADVHSATSQKAKTPAQFEAVRIVEKIEKDKAERVAKKKAEEGPLTYEDDFRKEWKKLGQAIVSAEDRRSGGFRPHADKRGEALAHQAWTEMVADAEKLPAPKDGGPRTIPPSLFIEKTAQLVQRRWDAEQTAPPMRGVRF